MVGFGGGIGISWTICKQSAPRSRQITTPTPHHLGWMLFHMPNQQCQSTEDKLAQCKFSQISATGNRFISVVHYVSTAELCGVAEGAVSSIADENTLIMYF